MKLILKNNGEIVKRVNGDYRECWNEMGRFTFEKEYPGYDLVVSEFEEDIDKNLLDIAVCLAEYKYYSKMNIVLDSDDKKLINELNKLVKREVQLNVQDDLDAAYWNERNISFKECSL